MPNYKEKLTTIKTFVFDYDGVFTDGIVYLMDNGAQVRTANARDGYALQLAIKQGYRICVITGALSKAIKERFERLKVSDVFLGSDNKKQILDDYIKKHNIKKEELLVMGDDIPDFHLLKAAHVATCPADAVEEIKLISDYISKKDGGKGCVRDIIEQVLRVQNNWMNDDAFHW